MHEVLARTEPGRLRHVIQLHLSRDCNRQRLAQEAAKAVLAQSGNVAIHTAHADRPGPSLVLGGEATAAPKRRRQVAARSPRGKSADSPALPGMDS